MGTVSRETGTYQHDPNERPAADPNQKVSFGSSGQPHDSAPSAPSDGSPVAGMRQVDTQTSAPGLAGLVGVQDGYSIYLPKQYQDPMYQVNRTRLLQGMNNTPDRRVFGTGPAAQAASGPQDQFRAQQMALAQQLAGQASGKSGPSAAETTLNRATDRSMQQALSLALTANPGNQIAALRQAQDQRAMTMQDAGQQASMLRAQEQQQAQTSLGNLLATGRGADIGLAQGNAQLTQGAAQANLQAAVQQQQQKDDMVRFYTQQGLALDQANLAAQIQQSQFTAGMINQGVAASHGVSTQNSAQGAQLAGAGMSALGALGAAAISDERQKTDIKDATVDLSEFLAKAGTHKYKYKNPDMSGAGKGEFISPMAQELERSKIGKSMVKETPEGVKIVDYGKGFGALLAALSMHQKRLDRMEASS